MVTGSDDGRRSGTLPDDAALDMLDRVGRAESRIDDAVVARLGAAAAARARGPRLALGPAADRQPAPGPDVVPPGPAVTPGGVGPGRAVTPDVVPLDPAGIPDERRVPARRVMAMAAVVLAVVAASIGALSRPEQVVVTDQATGVFPSPGPVPSGDRPESSVVEPSASPLSIVVSDGSTTETSPPSPSTTVPATTSTPDLPASSTASSTGATDAPVPAATAVRIPVGPAGTVALAVDQDGMNVVEVESAAGWDHRLDAVPPGSAVVAYAADDGRTASLLVESAADSFRLAVDPEGDGPLDLYAETHQLDVGPAGLASVTVGFDGLTLLAIDAADGWTVTAESRAADHLHLELSGDGFGLQRRIEFRVGALLITITARY